MASNGSLKLQRTTSANTFAGPDPFAPKSKRWGSSFVHAILSTALFRCWHILLFFGAWSTFVTVYSHRVQSLAIEPTLLTVIGTVLGFVISYRTTSSFERYNEGRRLWSTIILNCRTWSRLVWFHVPDVMPAEPGVEMSDAERKARTLVEKKTVINLAEAFSVAVKHYLRGEDGIFYEDLYYLVKFLPAYALPAGIPTGNEPTSPTSPTSPEHLTGDGITTKPGLSQRTASYSASVPNLPLPTTSPGRNFKPSFLDPPPTPHRTQLPSIGARMSHESKTNRSSIQITRQTMNVHEKEEGFLLPAQNPPKYHLFDLFPFSLLIKCLTKRGTEVKGKKAARLRAKVNRSITSHNLPLEISLYMSSYVAALQTRKAIDPPTANYLIGSVNQLVDALTGLERILTTPIPFSYSIHLWVVTIGYCLFLPFQIYDKLGWLTIPGTLIASFIFFGFLVAGEEIENPFGYDKNDLNLDHFTSQIIRNELRGITAVTRPDVSIWAFSADNDLVFASRSAEEAERVSPETWVQRGLPKMQTALAQL